MKLTNSIIFSITAVIISIASLSVAIRSCIIADQNFRLHLEPIISAEFAIHNDGSNYELKIINDGPIAIHDIKIEKRQIIYDFNKNKRRMAAYSGKNNWKTINTLQPKNNVIFTITNDVMDIFTIRNEFDKYNDETAILALFIHFRRDIDMKIYTLKKYLFLYKAIDTGKPIAIDPDETKFPGEKKLKSQLENYDNE